ncbi:MAG TPA: copper amine oxidase N-terminal domain-containing protein [Symbiobacteriaceae bacterium]|nr:copper amine oxidase N-terminal domain-containing protein [Symbiobacteriaceae bacterium]
MRVRSVLLVFLLSASCCFGTGPRPAEAAASGPCLPQRQLPVTVLARSAAGRPFDALEFEEAAPFIDADTGRTIVPLRSLISSLSPGTDGVRWYADIRTASFWHQGHTLSVRFPRDVDRSYSASLDNQSYSLTSYLCNGRVWVTARTVAEAFGIDIEYYKDGVVVIDGAGKDPWASQPARELAKCTPFPDRFTDYLVAPASSAQQAATAVACQLLSY